MADIAERPSTELDDILMSEMGASGATVGHSLYCLAFSIACRRMAFIRDWQPLPPALSQARTSSSRRVVVCFLTGRQCPGRFISASYASVSSDISLVSVSLSGIAAKPFEVVLMCFRQRRERIVCMFNRRHIASYLYALRDEPK